MAEASKAQDQLRQLSGQSASLGRSVQNLFTTPLEKNLRHHVTAVAALRQMRQAAPSAVIRHMAVHPAEKVRFLFFISLGSFQLSFVF